MNVILIKLKDKGDCIDMNTDIIRKDSEGMGVPYTEYKKLYDAYHQLMKKEVETVLRPKISEQFAKIAELIEQEVLSDEEAIQAITRAIRQYRLSKESN